ncbi:MAG: NAD(P)-dependent oxidoreductase [Fimbriimonadaceae bacterium]|nr:NAD(P)-dependent oxidoreductase [Fimbriimonadaceae bacterium]
MARVGFVGLGVMGGPMAAHLARAGHQVTVWNRTAGKASLAIEAGARESESLAKLPKDCDIVCICVGRTEDVQEVLAQMLPASAPGTLFIDHSTISPKGAQQIHSHLAARERRFLDAPITGGSMGAQKGQLTIFVGGAQKDFDEAAPVLDAYARRAALVGGPGAGQMMKAANQIAVGGALLALCESLAFAQKAGLDLATTRELLATGAAGSWAFENYGPKILARDWSPGFSVDNQLKDFGYCHEAAALTGAALPGMTAVEDYLKQLQAEGRGADTTAAVFEVLEREGRQ